MEIQNKIQKIGFWSGFFNTLKEYIPKSIEKERWTDKLPMGYTTEKFTKFEHYKKKEQYDANKDKIIGFNQMET